MSPCHKSLKKKRAQMQQQEKKKQTKKKQQGNFLLSFMDYVSGYIKAIVKR